MRTTSAPSANHVSPAFVLHALGGATFFTFLSSFLLGPVDWLVPLSPSRTTVVQCAVAGGIFYGFSLSLLWRRPLPIVWGVAYAAASLAFLVTVFTPQRIYEAGMMRRVADPRLYAAYEAAAQRTRTILQAALAVAFLLMQVAFLRTTLRPAPPHPPA